MLTLIHSCFFVAAFISPVLADSVWEGALRGGIIGGIIGGVAGAIIHLAKKKQAKNAPPKEPGEVDDDNKRSS